MKRILVLLVTLAMSGFGAFAQMQPRIGYDYATPNIGPELNAMRPSGELKINTIPGRSGGTGTFDDPYIVASEEELAEIATRVNSGTEASGTIFPNGNQGYAGQYFLMTKDLDLTDYTPWTPISIPGQKIFFGHFDGGGNTIRHLTIDLSTSHDNQGLFSVIGAEASISNLSIRESRVSGEIYIGPFVGAAGENSIISNCHNYCDVSTTFYYAGGIAGASWGVIESCTNSGNIGTEMDFVGGIVGDFYGIITGCVNTGNVSGTTSVGGIVGYSANAAIDHNVNAGNIYASSVYSGGVVGFVTNYDSENTTAYLLNVGGVYGASTRAVIGRLWTEEGMPSHANNCYYDCQMTNRKGLSPGNDVEGVAEPRFTHEMLGDGLSELISTGWTFADGLYPIPGIEPFPTEYSYIATTASVPASLRFISEDEYDRFNFVRDDFHIYYDLDGLTWESTTGKVSFHEDLAQLVEIGLDTLRVYYGDAKKEICIGITDMLGLTDDNQPNIAVYPNPTERYVYVAYDQPYQAMLYTTDGRLVGTCRHDLGNTHPIDLTAFTPGVYYLRLVNDDGIVATKKIVVTK